MSAPDDPRAPRPHKKRPWLRRFLITLAILFGLAALVWVFVDTISRTALKTQLAALQAADEPLTLAEWQARRPELGDQENSARVILSLISELEPLAKRDRSASAEELPFFGRGKLPNWSEPWPPETLSAIEEFLTRRAELIARLDAIHDLPRGRFPLDLTANPLAILLPNVTPLRTASRLQALAALRDAARGAQDDALARCQTILHLGAAVRNDPILIPALVSIAVDTLAVDTLERVMAVGTTDAELLAALQDLLRDHETNSAMPNGLRGERIFQLEMLEFVRKNGPQALAGVVTNDQIASWPGSLDWVLGGWVRLNQAKALELMAPLIEALDSPRETMDAAGAMEKNVRSLPGRYLLVKTLTPSLMGAAQLWTRHTAQLRCAQAGLAAERFRLAAGRWPASLEELVPDYLQAVPLDPFDEKPLRYKIEADRVVIYSIGEDEVDDDGQLVHPERPQATPPDTGFRLLNPELRGFKIAEPE